MLSNKNSDNNTKQKILEIATELFDKNGYCSTTLKEISEKAGITKGGLFYYYKSKEDILFEIHDLFISYELKKAIETKKLEKNNKNILKKLVVDLLKSIGKFKPYVSVFFQERRFFSQKKFLTIRKKRDKYENIFLEVIKKGIENGEFRNDIKPKLQVKALFGMCNWTHQWLNPEGELTSQQIGEIFFEIFIKGIEKNNK